MKRVVIVMGVSGSGKSTIAERVARHFSWVFQEGDDLHPPENVAKMKAGLPLDDSDRAPWLDAVARWVTGQLAKGEDGLITCSALKRAYRLRIGNGEPGVQIVYLRGERATLEARVRGRHHAFMPTTLLDSQLATLEPPTPDEHVIEVDVSGPLEESIATVIETLED